MSSILECRNLTKRYGSFAALNDLAFSIEPGRITGLLGPNGSGKTTLIKLACGLLAPDAGTLLIDGQRPGVLTKAHVSYLPDRLYFSGWMTVNGCLDYFSDFYADFDRKRAEDMLHNLGVTPQTRLTALSKGNLEKVQLVLVMARRARLYLLDEPMGGVDPAARDYILDTIISNYAEDAAIVISTHLIADVEKILDSYVFLNNGRIIEQGTCDAVREESGRSLDEHFREVFKCCAN